MPQVAIIASLWAPNAVLIEKYIDERKRGLSERRKTKIRGTLMKLGSVHLKAFTEVTKDDLEEFIDALRDDDLEEEYAQSTKVTYRKIMKPFFAWLHPEDKEFASWIKTGSFEATLGPDDILSPEELQLLREKCLTPRDRTMLESLYESAARPKEFLAAWKSDVTFEASGPATFHIDKGKTGNSRDILLFQDANPLLHKWIYNEHPLKNQQDFPLWVDMSRNSRHDALQTLGLRRFISRIARAANIQKRITPYTLRHTRLTDLAREGANEALLCEIAGWRLSSKMPSIYIHLSKRDQRPMMEKLLGIKKVEEEEKPKKVPIICTNCKATNTSDAKVCTMCGMALDTKTAVELLRKVEAEKLSYEKLIEEKMEQTAQAMIEQNRKWLQEELAKFNIKRDTKSNLL